MATKDTGTNRCVLTPKPGMTKDDIRKMVWEYLEKHDIADFPRPVHHRIPNFKGSPHACQRLADVDTFSAARCVKAGPDKPLEGCRLLCLERGKDLLVPTPRMRTGIVNRISPARAAAALRGQVLRACATSRGVREFSVPVDMSALPQVDLVIAGSVAVATNGWRLGKGEGYSDLEWAILRECGVVINSTTVLTVVHDTQVMDLDESLFGPHDLPVDLILTPSGIVECPSRPKPQGVVWSLLTRKRLREIPILTTLRERMRTSGRCVCVSDEDCRCNTQERRESTKVKVETESTHATETENKLQRTPEQLPTYKVRLDNLSERTQVRDLKLVLTELEIAHAQLTWRPAQGHAILTFVDLDDAEKARDVLKGVDISGSKLRTKLL